MQYDTCICFSADKAEELNRKAFELDKRLFLFAYYKPKSYPHEDSARIRFLTAAINIYGLIKDCAAFLPSLCRHLSNQPGTSELERSYWEIYAPATAFRSIFCHNSPDVYPICEEQQASATVWCAKNLGLPKEDIDIASLSNQQWEALLNNFCSACKRFIELLEQELKKLRTAYPTTKEEIIDLWIQELAWSYVLNPNYLLNAITSYFLLHNILTFQFTPKASLRNTVIPKILDWLDKQRYVIASKNKWYVWWLGESWWYTYHYDKKIRNYVNGTIKESKIYKILHSWQEEWSNFNNLPPEDCDEAPLPDGDLFKILANDIYKYCMRTHA